MTRALLSVNADAKTIKGATRGYLTGILYLAPYTSAGVLNGDGRALNVCPNASPGCVAACLFTAGRAAFTPSIPVARIRKTRELFADRKEFVSRLRKDVAKLCRKANREGAIPAVRLNGTSDLAWEGIAPEVFTENPDTVFYDYTKSHARMDAFLSGKLPPNYSLTFSLSETEASRSYAATVLARGGTVAAVFAVRPHEAKPERWQGFPVADGDASDLRFLDAPGTVAGLSAKGRAKGDTSGFVIR